MSSHDDMVFYIKTKTYIENFILFLLTLDHENFYFIF